MSAVEADGTALYSVEVFLAWLKARDMYPLDAHRAGCKEVGPVCRSQSTLSEALAIQWADCLEVEVADIWPEGALEEVKPAPLSLPPGMAASGLTREDFGLRPIREAPGEVRVLATPLVKSETMVKPPLGPNAAYCPVGCGVARTKAGMRAHINYLHPGADVDALWPKKEPSHATKPPVVLEPCPKCGKGGFVANSGRTAHVAKCKGAVTEGLNMSKRIDDERAPCPICGEPQLVNTGLRNHIRNNHKRDPDELLGVPEYRSHGGLAAQSIKAKEAAPYDPVLAVVALLSERVATLEAEKADLERQLARMKAALEALEALE